MCEERHDVLKSAEKYLGYGMPEHMKSFFDFRYPLKLSTVTFYGNRFGKRRFAALGLALTFGERKIICASKTEGGAQQQIDDILFACDTLGIPKDNFKFEKMVRGRIID